MLSIIWKRSFKFNKEGLQVQKCNFILKIKWSQKICLVPNLTEFKSKDFYVTSRKYSWNFVFGYFVFVDIIYLSYLVIHDKICFQMFYDNIWIRSCKNQNHTKYITSELNNWTSTKLVRRAMCEIGLHAKESADIPQGAAGLAPLPISF